MLKVILITSSILSVLLVLLCVYYNQALQIVSYEISKEEVPEAFWGTKVILLADLHNHEFGKKNEKLLRKIKSEQPDYIMIAGDLLVKDHNLQTRQMMDFLKKLAGEYPVFYAPGNHEEELEHRFAKEGSFDAFISEIQKAGVRYLANQSVYLEKKGQRMRITGLALAKKYFAKFYEKTELNLEELQELIGEKEAEYEVLLAHNPNYLPVYEKWGANLVLSGHVHGGVVILPFVGGVISTTFELFPKYDFGLFQSGKTKMVLTKGLAMHTVKLRLFNIPEISLIHLGR